MPRDSSLPSPGSPCLPAAATPSNPQDLFERLPRGTPKTLERLRDRLRSARNALVPLIGSGCSRAPHGQTGLPSWEDFLRSLGEGLEAEHQLLLERALTSKRYLAAAQLLWESSRVGPQEIRTLVRETFSDPKMPPPGIYSHLARLPCDHWLSTNWDPWLWRSLDAARGNFTVLSQDVPGGLEGLQVNAPPWLLHLHGVAGRPQSIVLTFAEYLRSGQNQALSQAMGALLAQRTLLLVGHSGFDPDLRLFLEQWSAQLNTSSELRHFMLNAGFDPLDVLELKHLGIKVIDIGDHQNLPAVVDWLAEPPVRPVVVRAVEARDPLDSLWEQQRSICDRLSGLFPGSAKSASQVRIHLRISSGALESPVGEASGRLTAGRGRGWGGESLRLQQLLAREPEPASIPGQPAEITGRWVLLAEAGAGKSTSLQQVVVDLADLRVRARRGESLAAEEQALLRDG